MMGVVGSSTAWARCCMTTTRSCRRRSYMTSAMSRRRSYMTSAMSRRRSHVTTASVTPSSAVHQGPSVCIEVSCQTVVATTIAHIH